MLEPIDNAPLAVRARAQILQAIMEDQFTDRLPSEDELSSMLNVSRTTIRTALHSLEQEGIITRRRAIGTTVNKHVRPSTLALQRLVGFDGLLREKGYDVRVETSWTRRRPPADIVAEFDFDPDQDVLLTEKRYDANGDLAIYIRDALPWSELAVDELEDEIPPSMFEFTREYCRRQVNHAVVEILPMVKREGVTQLEVAEGEAFARLLERHYSSKGELIAVSVVDVDDAYVRFEVFRRE
jgi:GntR family transcriptional regulator